MTGAITSKLAADTDEEEAFLLEDYQSDNDTVVNGRESKDEAGLSDKSMELAIK